MANLIGQVLNIQFRVDAFIASGGMGAVYKVYDLKRNVSRAMKMLHYDLADDPYVLKHFKREVRALEKLAHPNLVPFYSYFQSGDLLFMLERVVDGILTSSDVTILPQTRSSSVSAAPLSAVPVIAEGNVM